MTEDIIWRNKLQELSQLEKNWDSYGADTITTIAIDVATIILETLEAMSFPIPWIIPTADGGISFEWHKANAEFSLSINELGDLESVFIASKGDDYFELGGVG